MPALESGDDEGRFLKRDKGLDERELAFRRTVGPGASYTKSNAWEYREAFCFTYEVSIPRSSVFDLMLTRCSSLFSYIKIKMAGIVLDEFIAKLRPGSSKPTFRSSYILSQKDWSNPLLPKIRPRSLEDPTQPAEEGEGSVIYRFMVNHAKYQHLKGYDEWQKQLYPDPLLLPDLDELSGKEITSKPLHERYEDDSFAEMNLWKLAKAKYDQSGPRLTEEKLNEEWMKLKTGTGTIEEGQAADDAEIIPS
jgi:hypothetical protein